MSVTSDAEEEEEEDENRNIDDFVLDMLEGGSIEELSITIAEIFDDPLSAACHISSTIGCDAQQTVYANFNTRMS